MSTETLSRNPRHEPLESFDGNASAQRDAVPLKPVDGSIEIPDRYRDDRGFTKSWSECADEYTSYREDLRTLSHRGTPYHRANHNYRKALDVDRWTQQEYGEERHTVMLTFRISPQLRSHYLPPLEQIDAVLKAHSEAMNTLYEELIRGTDLRYKYFRILTGTKHLSSAHVHTMLYFDQKVTSEDFIPICETFVEECYLLDSMEKNRPEDGAVSVRSEHENDYVETDGDRMKVVSGSVYVASQHPHIAPIEEASESEKYFGAAMHASSKDAFSRSRGISRDEIYNREKIQGQEYRVTKAIDSTDSLSPDLQIHSTSPIPARPIQSMDTISIRRAKKPPPMHAD